MSAGMKLRSVAIANAFSSPASCDINVVEMPVMSSAIRGGALSGKYDPSVIMTTVLISYGVGWRE